MLLFFHRKNVLKQNTTVSNASDEPIGIMVHHLPRTILKAESERVKQFFDSRPTSKISSSNINLRHEQLESSGPSR